MDLISIIVPVYNEEDSLEAFVGRTKEVLRNINADHEIIFINDGSTDGTLERLLSFMSFDKHIRIVNLSRNFGKEAALTAGIENARGNAVIPMDVDLQDPPELIADFFAKWKEGYDIVFGVRAGRESDSLPKRITAGWFYQFFNKISSVKIPENTGDYRLMDRRVVEALKQLPERNRFMKGLFSWVGFKSVGVYYERGMRASGRTKWNYWKLWNFALDGLASFSTIPLKVWTYLGFIISMFSFLYGLHVIIKVVIWGRDVPGYASIMAAILFFGGIQLISLGVLGEYIGRLFVEAKCRPIYIIENIYENKS